MVSALDFDRYFKWLSILSYLLWYNGNLSMVNSRLYSFLYLAVSMYISNHICHISRMYISSTKGSGPKVKLLNYTNTSKLNLILLNGFESFEVKVKAYLIC